MSRVLNRRAFLRHIAFLSASGLAASACSGRSASQALATAQPASSAATVAPRTVEATTAPATGAAYLAVARGAGTDPAELTRRAVAAVGGIERFVKSGADVILKPNICNAYHGPEYASTTNPQVLAALVSLCLGAGAKRVRVLDYPFAGAAQAAYATSGIEAAVEAVR